MTSYTTQRVSGRQTLDTSTSTPLQMRLSTRYTPLSHPSSPTYSSATSLSPYSSTSSMGEECSCDSRSPSTRSPPSTPGTAPFSSTNLSPAADALLRILDLIVTSPRSSTHDNALPSPYSTSSTTITTQRISEALFLDTFHVFTSPRHTHSRYSKVTLPIPHFPTDAQSYVAARNELVRAGCVRWVRKRGELVVNLREARERERARWACREEMSDERLGCTTDEEDEVAGGGRLSMTIAREASATLRLLLDGAKEVGVRW